MGRRIDDPAFPNLGNALRPMGKPATAPKALIAIDKRSLVIPQAPPLRDRDYLDWFALLPCAVSGLMGETVGHHLLMDRKGGMGMRESDDRVVPLNVGYHTLRPDALHRFNGHERQWWEQWGIDADLLAAWLRESYIRDPRDIEAAIAIIHKCRPSAWMR